MKKIVVLGGGPTGLSAAQQIGLLKDTDVSLYEKNSRVGGVCGYHDFCGMRLDYGPHKIYSVLPGIMELFREIGGERLKEIKKKHRIILRHKLLDYPVSLFQMVSIFSPAEVFTLSFSVLLTMLKAPFFGKPLSYEDYCLKVFGKKIYKEVFEPLAEKTWGDPKTVSADIAKMRIPVKSIYELVLRVMKIRKESKETNAEYMLYPKKGFYAICEVFAELIKSQGNKVFLNKKPVKLKIDNNSVKKVVFNDSSEQEVDLLVSTIPMPDLMRLLFQGEDFSQSFLPMRHSIVVYLLVDKANVLTDHWLFCADKEYVFSRVAEQKLLSDEGFSSDKTVLSCDFTCDGSSEEWNSDNADIVKKCVGGLIRLGLIFDSQVLKADVVRIPNFYPVYCSGYENKLRDLYKKIGSFNNLISLGRLGLANYSNIDHCLDMGVFCAKALAEGLPVTDINMKLKQRISGYYIVD